MALTPLLLLATRSAGSAQPTTRRGRPTPSSPKGAPVIIAGFGRFGQIVGRLLFASGIRATVLDHDADQIELLRKFGFKVFYGDATRLDLLHAAGAAEAQPAGRRGRRHRRQPQAGRDRARALPAPRHRRARAQRHATGSSCASAASSSSSARPSSPRCGQGAAPCRALGIARLRGPRARRSLSASQRGATSTRCCRSSATRPADSRRPRPVASNWRSSSPRTAPPSIAPSDRGQPEVDPELLSERVPAGGDRDPEPGGRATTDREL